MRKLSIGKIKGIFFISVFFFSFLTMRGEESDATKEKMMEIKLNEDFIFGEGVSDDKEIAYGVAMDDLLTFANELKDRNSQEKLSMSDLLTKVETLVYEHGSHYEVIVYIPFKIVIETTRKDPSARGGGIMITKPGFVAEDDEPEIEDEELIVEDTQTDRPETPINPAPAIKEEPVVSLPAPVEEEKQAPVEEAIKEEMPRQEEPAPLMAQETPSIEVLQASVSPANAGEVEDFLLIQDNFSEIKSYLSDMKRSGKIVETGATDSTFNLPDNASLILIDELGGILAVLSPASAEGRINYRTNRSDSVNNYNSKFIVWYRK